MKSRSAFIYGIAICLIVFMTLALPALGTRSSTSTTQSTNPQGTSGPGPTGGDTASSWQAGPPGSQNGGGPSGSQNGAGPSGSASSGPGPQQSDQQGIQKYGLWITDSQNAQQITYKSVAAGTTVQFISYSPTAGSAKLYDIWEKGSELSGSITTINLAAGSSTGSYKASASGRHTLMIIAGQKASNAVIIDVTGSTGSQSGQQPSQPGWTAGGSAPTQPGGPNPSGFGTTGTTTRSVSITYGPYGTVTSGEGPILIDSADAGFDPYSGVTMVDSTENGFLSGEQSGEWI